MVMISVVGVSIIPPRSIIVAVVAAIVGPTIVGSAIVASIIIRAPITGSHRSEATEGE